MTCFVDVRRGRLLDVVRGRAADDVRRRTQQETLGHRSHKDDPWYSTRRLMTRGWERLSDRQRVKLLDALRSGDPDGEVGVAILAKELLRDMYATRSLTSARWKLVAFYQCAVRRGPRTHPTGQDGVQLGDRDLELPRDRHLEWTHRSSEPHR